MHKGCLQIRFGLELQKFWSIIAYLTGLIYCIFNICLQNFSNQENC